MDAQLVARAEMLRQTAERLARIGLVVERGCLSPQQRRASFVLQCAAVAASAHPEPKRAPIGFDYPNAR